MRQTALRARLRRRKMPLDTGVRSTNAVAPNVLDRTFTATSANRKWVADCTYLWSAEGCLYVETGGQLVHACDDDHAPGHGCTRDGDLAAWQA